MLLKRCIFIFYRRKFYTVKSEFVEILNANFNDTNFPNQLKHCARLVGRWMKANKDYTVEIFAVWEYDNYEKYLEIESKVRNDKAHVKRVQDWYQKYGGKEHVLKKYLLEVKNEPIESTVK